jgi:ferritin
MLNLSILNDINEQITVEKFASNSYQQIACWFSSKGLQGFCKYFMDQASDEASHSQKLIDYVLQHFCKVQILPINAPVKEWDSCISVASYVLELERSVTDKISAIMYQAVSDNDFATQTFLQWFVDEQVRSEFEANDMLQKLIIIGDDAGALLAMDHELGESE